MKRIAVIGAGGMARVRAKAFLAAGGAVICGVASKRMESARAFAGEIGCDAFFDGYSRLPETSPDAVLVEVPHGVQDDAVRWALGEGLHVLIGGCLAGTSAAGESITAMASERDLVVEAGYDARYHAAWETLHDLLEDGVLGRLVAVRSIALWDGDPATWYYREAESGGMPLTHMTYCFINPVRWLLGDPLCVSAFANRVRETAPEMIREETCVANFRFPDEVLCSMTAGFVKPGDVPGWSALFIGTNAAAEVFPEENRVVVYHMGSTEQINLADARDPFEAQAEVFLAALDGPNACRNTPGQTLGDIRTAEAIVESCRTGATIEIGDTA